MAFFLMLGLWITTILLILPHVRLHYLIYLLTPVLALLAFWYRWSKVSRAGWFALGTVIVAFICQILTSKDATGRELSRLFDLYGGNTLQVLSLYTGCAVSLLQLERGGKANVESGTIVVPMKESRETPATESLEGASK